MMLNKLKLLIQKSWAHPTHRQIIIAFFFLITISTSHLFYSEKSNVPTLENHLKADTVIPRGYVLHPIVLENIESIKAIIDQFGVIDLYAGQQLQTGSNKIADQIKIIRAPLNPNEYALLIPERLSEKIMKAQGPYWGVIRNPDSLTERKAELEIKKIQIEYKKESL